jgi:4'-phosphopantetheinyl transferase
VSGEAPAPREEPLALPSPEPGVACWVASLEVTHARVRAGEALLSAPEIERAARFGTEDLRARYVLGRGALRMVLANRLRCHPRDVPLRRGYRGRPFVEGADGLDFNVSHTRDVALIAVAERARIGVDVEHEDRRTNAEGLARKFLTERERAALAALDADERRRRFLRSWTCKEAMSKATGDGIAAPFRRIDIDIDGLRPLDGVAPYGPADWRLRAIRGLKGFIATLAIWDGSPDSRPLPMGHIPERTSSPAR